jgi:hypothetical protein
MAKEQTECKEHSLSWSKYCGAYVCSKCGAHFVQKGGQQLARCFCGYNLENGERLEDDIGDSTFDGETWEVDY